MNKDQLAAILADKCNLTKKQTENVIKTMLDVITETIKKDEEVVLTGFGTFSSRVRKGRKGFNPQNLSERIDIPPTRVVKFKAGKTLKDALKAAGSSTASNEPSSDMSDSSEEEESSEEVSVSNME